MLDDRSDEDLVLGYARSAETDALEELARRHWSLAYRLSLHLLGESAAAEDAAQEAFVALARGAKTFARERSFGPWFRTVVLNAARDRARSRKTRERHERRAAAARSRESASPASEGALESAEVAAELGRLPYELRVALVLHYYDGWSHDEVATILGCPKTTARSRIRRGVEQLRESLVGAGTLCTVVQLEEHLSRARAASASMGAPARPSGSALARIARGRAAFALAVKGMAAAILVGLSAASFVHFSRKNETGRAAAAPPELAGSRAPDTTPSPGGGGNTSPLSSQSGTAGDARDGVAQATTGTLDPLSGIAEGSWGFVVQVVDQAGKPVKDAYVYGGAGLRHGDADEVEADRARIYAKLEPRYGARWTNGMGSTDETGRLIQPAFVFNSEAQPLVFVARLGLDEGWTGPIAVPEQGKVSVVRIVLKAPKEVPPDRGSVIVHLSTAEGPLADTGGFGAFDVNVLHEKDFPGPSNGNSGAQVPFVKTDQDGCFALHELPVGLAGVVVTFEDFLPTTAKLDVQPGRVTEAHVTLAPGATIKGRVVAPGRQLDPHTTVYFKGPKESSMPLDAEGRFRRRGLVKGDYRITVLAPGFGLVRTSTRVERLEETLLPDMVLGQGAVLSGRALGMNGVPHGNASVVVSNASRSVMGLTVTESDGRFRIAGLPRGKTRLGVALKAGETWALSGGEIDAFTERHLHWTTIEIPESGDAEAGDVVGPFALRTHLSGVVLGPDGRAVDQAEVIVSGPARGVPSLKTDAQGRFDADLSSDGDYVVAARSGDLVCYEPSTTHVRRGEGSEVELRLGRGGRISGVVTGDPKRVRDLTLVADPDVEGGPTAMRALPRPESRPDRDGRFLFPGLVPGRYRVWAPGAIVGLEVEVRPDREETVSFELPRGSARVTVEAPVSGGEAIAYRGTLRESPFLVEGLASATIKDGRATLENLPPGTIGVGLRTGDALIFQEGLTATEDGPLALRFDVPDPGSHGTLVGHAVTSHGKALVVAISDRIVAYAALQPEGAFTMSVPAGEYHLAVVDPSRPSSTTRWSRSPAVIVEAGKQATAPLLDDRNER
jgi:RNA polymerase sigma-70 factor (ECF subfamily)